jgi:hypothetical protein
MERTDGNERVEGSEDKSEFEHLVLSGEKKKLATSRMCSNSEIR